MIRVFAAYPAEFGRIYGYAVQSGLDPDPRTGLPGKSGSQRTGLPEIQTWIRADRPTQADPADRTGLADPRTGLAYPTCRRYAPGAYLAHFRPDRVVYL